MDIRRTLMSLVQRAGSKLSPPPRALKLAALVLISLMLYWKLKPPSRPHNVTDLVLKTSDLRDVAAGAGKPISTISPGDDHHSPAANGSAGGAQPLSKHVMNCNPDIRRLREIRDRYELDDEIEYLKRYVRFTRTPGIERPSYTVLQQSFLPDNNVEHKNFRVLHLSTSDHHEEAGEKCPSPLEISVPESPFPADVDLSDFMFAISTTVKRLSDHPTIIQEWAHWLTDGNDKSNGGKLLLRLLDASEAERVDVAQRLADAGIDAEVGAWDSRKEKEMAVRYLNLVPLLFSHESSPTKKWFVLCDDDTFFPAINSLVARFKRYDHTKPLYIGTLSEDASAVATHGSQAFGGAGVFLSRPLARILSSVHETCKTRKKIKQSNSGWGAQGDILLRKCIYENTHQLDLAGGDASGFYEVGFKPYSVHHFRDSGGGDHLWHTAYPLGTAQIAHTCGEDCPYQRFVTKDDFVIANGYSVAQYPGGIDDDLDLDQVERTFRALLDDKGWNFDYTFGPQRPALRGTGKKIAWELRESERGVGDGSVVQAYVRRKDDERWTTGEGTRMRERDGVIELVWIPA
ncbi:hypothetical protein C8A03DRAFT_41632 [Achaetomium macrosporum]|uniref:Fringe-like glycosyltransferase domain-containing protein n=1 Tax=Achaetomium macrosporum TaxID=79813 RepID=A0AAN7H966_9PEZI|nr:hypothetical protein C8A03DRAFT_41632 [Achaetomium macrosporum]